jgi:hypothetical protein
MSKSFFNNNSNCKINLKKNPLESSSDIFRFHGLFLYCYQIIRRTR